MADELVLTVNDKPIRTDGFVKAFVIHTVSGMMGSLKGTDAVKELRLSVDTSKIKLELNGKSIPTNFFSSKIIRSTLFGMVSVLTGVSDPKKLSIEIRR